jgi:hypothetical protein
MKSQPVRAVVFAFWVILACVLGASATDFGAWEQRAKVTFGGYGKAETLTNFPALVCLGTNISGFSYSQFSSTNGSDLRFADSSQTNELNYEVEKWNTGGTSFVWVQVPQFTNKCYVWAYWGNSATNLPVYATNGATWNADFRGVWHLGEMSGTASHFDSTANGNNATTNGTTSMGTTGVVDGAAAYTGSDIGRITNVNNSLTITGKVLTVGIWIQPTANLNQVAKVGFLGKLQESGGAGADYGLFYDWTAVHFAGGGMDFSTGYDPPINTWTYLAGVCDGSYLRLYVNGAQYASTACSGNTPNSSGYPVLLGGGHWGGKLNGKLDEGRIMAVAASSNWVWACYMTMMSNNLFTTYEAASRISALIANQPASDIMLTSATLNGYLWSTGRPPTSAWVLLGTNNIGATTNGWLGSYYLGQQQGIGQLSTNITGLTPDTTYYYRFYATDAAGTNFASANEVFITGNMQLQASIPNASEEYLVNGQFEIWRSASVAAESLMVYYTLSGNAINGVNYSNLTGVITLAAGATNAFIPVNVIRDGVWNKDMETVTLTLSAGPYVVGAQSVASVTITPWPVLRIAKVDRLGADLSLEVTGMVANLRYTIERSPSLLQTGWTAVASFNGLGKSTNWMNAIQPQDDGPQFFYRVVLGGHSDWPQWGRAAIRNMVSDQTGLPGTFSLPVNLNSATNWNLSTATNVKWIACMGTETFGSPVVSAGKVLVGTSTLQNDPKYTGDRGTLLCLDEATGAMIWRLSSPRNPTNTDLIPGVDLGICSSATVEGDRAYVGGYQCDILCVDMKGLADGNDGPFTNEASYFAGPGNQAVTLDTNDADIIWQYDVYQQLGINSHDAFISSPVIYGDRLYTSTGNSVNRGHSVSDTPTAPSLIVLDKNTGQLLAQDDEMICTNVFHGQWSPPSLAMVNGQPLILYGAGNGFCYAFNPEPVPFNGRAAGTLQKVWWFDANYLSGAPKKTEIIASPVCWSNRVYVAVGQDWTHPDMIGQLVCMDATKTGDISSAGMLWKYNQIMQSIATCSVVDGLVYITDLGGKIHCLDAMTGATNWVFNSGSPFWGCTLVADGKVYAANSGGIFYILSAGRTQNTLYQTTLGCQFAGSIIAADNTIFFASYQRLISLQPPQQ